MTEEDLQLPPPIGPFFRFPNEATAMEALRKNGFTQQDESGKEVIIAATHTRAIDVIGTISRGGEWDDEGNVITPPEVLDGWHLNYRGVVPDGWDVYAVWPEQPVRVWA